MSRLKHLIVEIHRRSVWQVLGIYVVGAWVIWQVVGSMYEWIGLPDWVPVTALIILITGLPLVLATAFVQEGGPRIGEATDGTGSPGDSEPPSPAGVSQSSTSAPADRAPVSGPYDPAHEPADVHDPRAPTASTFFTWNRAITAVVLAFAVLGLAATGFMGMRWMGIGPAATLISSGELEARDPIVLADFAVTARDTTLGTLVTEALRVDLTESPVVSLASEVQVESALQRMRRSASARLDEDAAREVAVREGFKAVLAGEVREAAGSYVLTARLVTPDSGRDLAAFRRTARDSTELVAAIDGLSEDIREKVGESLVSVRSAEPLERVTTSSLAALRLYSMGRYEDAVAVDSTFAMAWRRWGVVAANNQVRRSTQVEAFTRAYELRDQLGPRERGLAEQSYYTNVLGDFARAERTLHTLLASYPDDAYALNNVGWIHHLREDWEAAVEWYRKARRGSAAQSFANLVSALVALGRVDSAYALIDSVQSAYPEWGRPLLQRAYLLIEEGRYEESDSVAAELRALGGELSPHNWWALGIEAENDAVRGRLTEALAHRERRRWLGRQEGVYYEYLISERLEIAATEAREIAWIGGDRHRAVEVLDEAVAAIPLDSLHPLDRPYGDLASAYAHAGALDRARRYAAAYDSVAPGHWSHGEDQYVSRWVGEGLIALEEGRPDAALRHFRRVNEEVFSCNGACFLPLIGRAHELAGRADSAIAAYQRYLDRLDNHGLGHGPIYLTLTLQRLPELYEARGDREAAARLYARFIDLWKDADPELQPRVEAARRALARLTREGV